MNTRWCKWFFVLFMLPFLGVAGWMGFKTVQEIRKVEAARSWREVPAEITSCVLRRHSGSRGGPTYKVEAHYTYTVDSKKYNASKVSFYSGSDNIGTFHKKTFFALETARHTKKSFPCWVNPQNPEEVVLIRDLRPEMIGFQLFFVFTFGGVASTLLLGILFAAGSTRSANGNIRMRFSGLHRPLLLAALLADAFAIWLLWKVLVLTGGIFNMPWYLWLCLLPGVALTAYGLYAWRRFSKFGISELALSSALVRLGDRINATVLIPRLVEGDFKGVLSCIHQYTSGTGKHRTTHHDVLWSSEVISRGSPAGVDLTQVLFRFELPDSARPTQEKGSTKYYWRLKVSSKLPGVDYKAEFDVSVTD
jgi:hypothetical protein